MAHGILINHHPDLIWFINIFLPTLSKILLKMSFGKCSVICLTALQSLGQLPIGPAVTWLTMVTHTATESSHFHLPLTPLESVNGYIRWAIFNTFEGKALEYDTKNDNLASIYVLFFKE